MIKAFLYILGGAGVSFLFMTAVFLIMNLMLYSPLLLLILICIVMGGWMGYEVYKSSYSDDQS